MLSINCVIQCYKVKLFYVKYTHQMFDIQAQYMAMCYTKNLLGTGQNAYDLSCSPC